MLILNVFFYWKVHRVWFECFFFDVIIPKNWFERFFLPSLFWDHNILTIKCGLRLFWVQFEWYTQHQSNNYMRSNLTQTSLTSLNCKNVMDLKQTRRQTTQFQPVSNVTQFQNHHVPSKHHRYLKFHSNHSYVDFFWCYYTKKNGLRVFFCRVYFETTIFLQLSVV